MSHLSSDARRAVMAVISDDHNAEAGEAALRQIVAMVSQIGGEADRVRSAPARRRCC
jgi:hypothetical protein